MPGRRRAGASYRERSRAAGAIRRRTVRCASPSG